jgi:hypothetical protein
LWRAGVTLPATLVRLLGLDGQFSLFLLVTYCQALFIGLNELYHNLLIKKIQIKVLNIHLKPH